MKPETKTVELIMKTPLLNINISIIVVLVITSAVANTELNITNSAKVPDLEVTIYKQTGTKADLCKERPCIRKCCRITGIAYMIDKFGNSGMCNSKKALNVTLSLPNPHIYNRDLEIIGNELNSTFQILKGYSVVRDGWIVKRNYFILEDGNLLVEKPNHYDRYVEYEVDQFCVDYVKLFESDDIVIRPFVLIHNNTDQEPDHTVSLVAYLISSAFLSVTLAVYCYVPSLNVELHGKLVISYTACLLGFFLTQSILQLVYEVHGSIKILCHILGVPAYFAILASFFWMNIWSYDYWIRIRNISNPRVLSRKEEVEMFNKYCCYGFGTPLAITIAFALLNYLPMDIINSAVVTPGITSKGCFLGGMERLFYLYIPLAIILAINAVLFVAISMKMYLTNMKIKQNRKIKFVICVKVFLVMGISWILAIISSFAPNHFAWKFAEAYNGLMGFFVFVIFVCNKKVFNNISERYWQ